LKCPGCEHENPSPAKFCRECGTPTGTVTPAASYADLQAEIEGLRQALGESLEQQTATSNILKAISTSPTDGQPVFDMMAEAAVKLCDAELSIVTTLKRDHLELAAV